MKHLVESHIGGFYISEDDPKVIEKPCEHGGHNVIVFSYDGELVTALEEYFSKLFLSKKEINDMIKKNYEESTILENINFRYDLNKVMLDCLAGGKIISFDDKMQLLPIILNSQKDNLLLYNSIKLDQKQKKLVKKIRR